MIRQNDEIVIFHAFEEAIYQSMIFRTIFCEKIEKNMYKCYASTVQLVVPQHTFLTWLINN